MKTIQTQGLSYGKLEIVDIEKHQGLYIQDAQAFSLAKTLTHISINIVEFSACVANYPILFAGSGMAMPIILTGLEDEQNRFIGADGNWQAGCYIPASIRSHPFVVEEEENDATFRLFLDIESPLLSKDSGNKLFENNAPTNYLSQRAKFAALYAREQARTYNFIKECIALDIMTDNIITLRRHNKTRTISGLSTIHPDRFAGLSDDIIRHWWQMGYMGLVYGHLHSLTHLHNYFDKNSIVA